MRSDTDTHTYTCTHTYTYSNTHAYKHNPIGFEMSDALVVVYNFRCHKNINTHAYHKELCMCDCVAVCKWVCYVCWVSGGFGSSEHEGVKDQPLHLASSPTIISSFYTS